MFYMIFYIVGIYNIQYYLAIFKFNMQNLEIVILDASHYSNSFPILKIYKFAYGFSYIKL